MLTICDLTCCGPATYRVPIDIFESEKEDGRWRFGGRVKFWRVRSLLTSPRGDILILQGRFSSSQSMSKRIHCTQIYHFKSGLRFNRGILFTTEAYESCVREESLQRLLQIEGNKILIEIHVSLGVRAICNYSHRSAFTSQDERKPTLTSRLSSFTMIPDFLR